MCIGLLGLVWEETQPLIDYIIVIIVLNQLTSQFTPSNNVHEKPIRTGCPHLIFLHIGYNYPFLHLFYNFFLSLLIKRERTKATYLNPHNIIANLLQRSTGSVITQTLINKKNWQYWSSGYLVT
jgi:hypothetical protein